MGERWTWDGSSRVDLDRVFSVSDWWDRLEGVAADAVTGKVLCVCAALAVAREVMRLSPADPLWAGAMSLLEGWIDDPTDEAFDRICETIFAPDSPAEIGPHGVGWWALRTATSAVGCGEAAWALSGTIRAAAASGLSPELLRSVAEGEILARRSRADPEARA